MTASLDERVAAVAFCADQLMEAPLHVAASSLLRSIHADYSVHFYMVLTGFSSRAVQRLRRTLDSTGRNYELKALEVPDPTLFRGFRPLLGSLTTYHRLILPDIVQERRLLYLDSDMQVKTDVSPLFTLDMGSKAMGFVVDGSVKFALESKFFFSLGASPDDPAFNAGTMLFNLPEWRRQDCSARVLDFCRKHSDQLFAADQTALNALFAKDCFHLERRYNVKVFPAAGIRDIAQNGITHYVGSPKPWDLGGNWLLPYAKPWWNDLRLCAVPLHQRSSWLSASSWRRFPKILGGYRRILRMSRQQSREARSS